MTEEQQAMLAALIESQTHLVAVLGELAQSIAMLASALAEGEGAEPVVGHGGLAG